jgi:NAD(P)-dependent dehydrogenase (short-subunit alcohol dehydrogenase family)
MFRTPWGGECKFYSVNLASKYDRDGIVNIVVDDFGGLDLLVNNAGYQNHHSVLDYTEEEFAHDLELMLTAPIDLSISAATYMLVHDGGHIINILSTSAFQGARNILGYTVAKHGLLGATRAMAIELAPKIHVNAVAPGLVETDMTKSYITPERKAFLESITPAGRFCKPKEIADAVLYLAKSTAIYGQTIVVDNGWLAKNG